MSILTFANPWGFLALLGVPVILAIHFLQRESRRVTASTLFLLEQLSPVSAQGRRLERLRNSVPLWLQLLMVALLAWLLAQPRWLRKDSTQRVVVVLDSSVSMTAFREPMLHALHERLTGLSHAAMHNEWMLVESDTSRGTIFTPAAISPLFSPRWTSGSRTSARMIPRPPFALRKASCGALACSCSSPTGAPLCPTMLTCLPSGRRSTIAVLPACALTPPTAGRSGMRSLKTTARRHRNALGGWKAPGAKVRPEEITIQPGQALELQGSFPGDAEKGDLVLSPDRFALDDRMPVIRPQPKRLKLFAGKNEATDTFFDRFLATIEAAERVETNADVQLLPLDLNAPLASSGHAVFFALQPDEPSKYLTGPVVTESHPFTEDLNWQGLVCRETRSIAPQPHDEVLVWQGGRALIFLRGTGVDRSLVLNFDLRHSNADRLPAFVVLLHRFIEEIRAEKVSVESRNVETNQLINVASSPTGPRPRIVNQNPQAASPILRAPDEPGYFEVGQGDTTLLRAASHFADAREADFREAGSFDSLQNKAAKLIAKNSRQDFLAPLWALLLGVVCLTNWNFTAKSK